MSLSLGRDCSGRFGQAVVASAFWDSIFNVLDRDHAKEMAFVSSDVKTRWSFRFILPKLMGPTA